MGSAKVSTRSTRLRVALVAATFAVVSIGAAVPVAGAQEPGVVYEPGSPSDKEYAIPLEEARRDAGGGRPGGEVSLPFGIGISRRGGGGPGSGSADDRRGARRGQPGGEMRSGGGSPSESRGVGGRLADAQEAAAPLLWKLVPFVLVLLPGLLVGLVLARRGAQQPAT